VLRTLSKYHVPPTVLAPKAHSVNLLYVRRVVSTVIYSKITCLGSLLYHKLR
jgi:hypothetical protein